MSLISQSIPNLINGVSQQPPSLRMKTQAEEQINGLSSVVEGLKKRPCTEHIAKLDVSDVDNSFIHTIRRDDTEFYTLVINSGTVRVFDKAGNEKTVTGDTSYIAGLASPSTDITAVTVADYTFVLNKKKVVAKGTEKSPARPYEALVNVKAGYYGKTYKIIINGNVVASYTTPDGSSSSHSTYISTDNIAANLYNGLVSSTQASAIASPYGSGYILPSGATQANVVGVEARYSYTTTTTTGFGDTTTTTTTSDWVPATKVWTGTNTFSVTSPSSIVDVRVIYISGTSNPWNAKLYGSIIHLSTTVADFSIRTEDGFNNGAMVAVKDKLGKFTDLPANAAVAGFAVQIIGSEKTQGTENNYWVKFESTTSNGTGVWAETVKPDSLISLDKSTMPHQLVKQEDGSFKFEAIDWSDREAGDDETNSFPSFVGATINDIFFHKNRLGFLSDENVILSEASEFYNFFVRSVMVSLDSSPIDVAVSNNQVSILQHAVPFNESLMMFSSLAQFRLNNDQLLAPSTVSIDILSQFEASTRAKPVPAGKFVFFPTRRGKWSGVQEYFVESTTDSNTNSNDITAHVPKYIDGTIFKLSASSNENMILALADGNRNRMYVYKYFWNGSEKLQSSWSIWEFDSPVINADFNNSEIIVLLNRGDGLCLERINLSTDTARTYTKDNHAVLLDRRVRLYSGGPTAVPYVDPNVIYVSYDGSQIPASKVASELTKGSVFAGIPYTFKYRFSEQVMINDKSPVTIGRLQIRNFNLVYNDTGYFKIVVKPKARDTTEYVFTGRIVGADSSILGKVPISSGTFKAPVLARSTEVDIYLESSSHFPCVFQSAEWEGFYTLRSQRI